MVAVDDDQWRTLMTWWQWWCHASWCGRRDDNYVLLRTKFPERDQDGDYDDPVTAVIITVRTAFMFMMTLTTTMTTTMTMTTTRVVVVTMTTTMMIMMMGMVTGRPCELRCQSSTGWIHSFSNALDGTRCYNNVNLTHVCIRGLCQVSVLALRLIFFIFFFHRFSPFNSCLTPSLPWCHLKTTN